MPNDTQANPQMSQTPSSGATVSHPVNGVPSSAVTTPAAGQPNQQPGVASQSGQSGNPPSSGGNSVPLASLLEERDKRQSMQAELAALKAEIASMKGAARIQQPQQMTPQRPPAFDVKAHLDKLWETDPRRAVQEEIVLAAQWMDQTNAQVEQEAAELSSKYNDFNDFRNQAMGYVRSLPLEQRARPGVVETAYLLVRGQNVDVLLERQRAALSQQFVQNPSMFQVPPGMSGVPVTSKAKSLSDDQARAASAMGISPEEYLKYVR